MGAFVKGEYRKIEESMYCAFVQRDWGMCKLLIDRISSSVDRVKGEDQCGFSEGRGCVDQIFAVRQLCDKYLGVNKEVYMAFMDLEKAYDKIDRNALW